LDIAGFPVFQPLLQGTIIELAHRLANVLDQRDDGGSLGQLAEDVGHSQLVVVI